MWTCCLLCPSFCLFFCVCLLSPSSICFSVSVCHVHLSVCFSVCCVHLSVCFSVSVCFCVSVFGEQYRLKDLRKLKGNNVGFSHLGCHFIGVFVLFLPLLIMFLFRYMCHLGICHFFKYLFLVFECMGLSLKNT